MSDVFPLFLLVGFFVIMWLLFIRPQQRRQRELASMQGSLEVGDEVMLTSGVYGVLVAFDDEAAHLEIADDVVIRVTRPAIGRLIAATDAEQDDPQDDEQDDVYGDQDEDLVDEETDGSTAVTGDPHRSPTRDTDVPEEN